MAGGVDNSVKMENDGGTKLRKRVTEDGGW